MFCGKCGKPNDEDALFCEFCGAPIVTLNKNTGSELPSALPPVEQPAAMSVQPTAEPSIQQPTEQPAAMSAQPVVEPPVQQSTRQFAAAAAQPAAEPSVQPPTEQFTPMPDWSAVPPMSAPMQAASAAVPKKRSKAGKIVAIAVSAAVVIAAAILLFMFWKKQSAEKPKMTVDGKNIPIDMTIYTSYTDYYYNLERFTAIFFGKTEDEAYICQVYFPEKPTTDTDYAIMGDDSDDVQYLFSCSSNETKVEDGFHTFEWSYYKVDSTARPISVGKCDPYKFINIAVAGGTEPTGFGELDHEFEFKVSGKIDYTKYSEEEGDKVLEDWMKNNMIHASEADTPTSVPSQTEQPSQPVNENKDEIEIKGEKYSTDLTFLDLSGKDLNDWDIQDLKYMTKLERIELSNNNLGDISILQAIPSLVEIDADNNSISNISFLSELSNIKIVVMNNNRISDISVFENIPAIQKIWLNDNFITDISPIANCTNLTEIGFDNCQINDISVLNRMVRLQQLSLYNTGITDISVLSNCFSLKKLNIGGNEIDDISALDKLKLEEFYVD